MMMAGAAVVACAIALWGFTERSLQSIQAYVNTGVSVVRSPIAGKLLIDPRVIMGKDITDSEVLGAVAGTVANSRESQLRISEQQILGRLANIEQQLVGVKERRTKRRQQLEIARDLADAEATRVRRLFASQMTSKATYDQVVGSARLASAQLKTELTELSQEENDLSRALQSAKEELAVVRLELGSHENAALYSPSSGVIWSIDAQTNENVAEGTSIMRVVNCQDVWVEAFFDEADIDDVKVGQPVEIRSLNGRREWRGTVATMRAGPGRVNIGQYVDDPPPEIMRRQLPVRVFAARIRVEWNEGDLVPQQFCMAGRSVSVKVMQ